MSPSVAHTYRENCILFDATLGCDFALTTVCWVCFSFSLGDLLIPSPGGEKEFSFPLFDRNHGGEKSASLEISFSNKMDDA
jgi:hypothetical protein